MRKRYTVFITCVQVNPRKRVKIRRIWMLCDYAILVKYEFVDVNRLFWDAHCLKNLTIKKYLGGLRIEVTVKDLFKNFVEYSSERRVFTDCFTNITSPHQNQNSCKLIENRFACLSGNWGILEFWKKSGKYQESDYFLSKNLKQQWKIWMGP